MKAMIEVQDRKEARHIRAGLLDPATRAVVIVMGALSSLPSDRSRMRVLSYVEDLLDESEHAEHKKRAASLPPSVSAE
jgi:demethoxyubiquinone hydroxylase (CLK1/Coq7/Cat5 family)